MQLGTTLVCAIIFSGCASTPSVEQFNNAVLPSLAEERANARIDWLQASARSGKWDTKTVGALAAWITSGSPVGAALGASAAEFVNRRIDDQTSRFETLRKPLEEELLKVFTHRSRLVGDIVQLCVEGTERRYQWQDKQFQRISNGPGPCEQTPLSTLAQE